MLETRERMTPSPRNSFYNVLSTSCSSLASLVSLSDLASPSEVVASFKRISGLEPTVAYKSNSTWWPSKESIDESKTRTRSNSNPLAPKKGRPRLQTGEGSLPSVPTCKAHATVQHDTEFQEQVNQLSQKMWDLDSVASKSSGSTLAGSTTSRSRSNSRTLLPTSISNRSLRPSPLMREYDSDERSLSSSWSEGSRASTRSSQTASSTSTGRSRRSTFQASASLQGGDSPRSLKRRATLTSTENLRKCSLYAPVQLAPTRPSGHSSSHSNLNTLLKVEEGEAPADHPDEEHFVFVKPHQRHASHERRRPSGRFSHLRM